MTSSFRTLLACLACACFAAGPALADPDNLHIGPTAPDGLAAGWSGGPYTAVNATNNIQDEPDCAAVPNSCDDMLLKVDLPAGYTAANPTHILLITVSWTPATPNQDVDVYFQDPISGNSIHPAAATSANPEIAAITLQDGITDIRVRCLMFSAQALNFTGSVSIAAAPVGVTGDGVYNLSNDIWSCNTHLAGPADFVGGTAFNHSNDGEPALKFDPNGRGYAAAIAGVPAGSGLWTTQDACAQSYQFLGAVDRGVGGGDTDVETATSENLLGNYNVYVSSLTLANISMSMSCDGGNTFTVTPFSTPFPIDDRQWNAAHGANLCYLSYRQGATSPGNFLECVRLTYADCVGQPVTNAPILVWDNAVANPPTWSRQLGNMATDRREHADNLLLQAGPNGEGAIYHGYSQGNQTSGSPEVWVANSKDFNTTTPWNNVLVWTGVPGQTFDHIFTWVSVDHDGNVWTTWSDNSNVYYSVSTNQGATWSDGIRINAGGPSRTAIFPHVVGGAGGRAVFTFYGHGGLGPDDPDADWDVFVSNVTNGLDAFNWQTTDVVFEETAINNRTFHLGAVCQNGLGCGCCRELTECYDIDINPTNGRAMVTYGAFGGSYGGSYLSNQLTGTNNLTGAPLTDLSGSCPNPADSCVAVSVCGLADPPCNCPGCTILSELDVDDVPPVDIAELNIRELHVAEPHVNDTVDPVVASVPDVIAFSLQVESLDPDNLPANVIWQCIIGSTYWVRVLNCAITGSPIGEYGHFETSTVTDGPLDHFELGADGSICMWVSRANIGNPGPGDILSITGHTRQLAGNCPGGPSAFPEVDATNAAQYPVIGNNSPLCDTNTSVAVTSSIDAFQLSLAGPNPFRESTAISYALPAPSHVNVSVYNVAGQLVRTLVNREEGRGTYTVSFDGLSDQGRALGAGVYMLRFRAGGYAKTVRLVSLQ